MKTGIIGIGLIGASLAHDLMAAGGHEVHVHDSNADHLAIARDLNIGHVWHDDLPGMAAACDLVFVCVPVRAIGMVVWAAAKHMKPGAILTDVGSVKGPVIEAARGAGLPSHISFVPGHPAAGLEYSGPASGIPGLFAGKAWVLTPDARTDAAAVQTVHDLIACVTGARMLTLDAATHDRIFAYTSHMAHVLAFAAMNATPQVSRNAGENILPYAGTSYRDLTRVANADAIMWRDIFLTNAKAIDESLDLYLAEIKKLRAMIDAKDEAGLMAYIASSTALRADMDKTVGGPGPSVPTPPPGAAS
jgi:cyclohexadieny/prephenate dehydrogenase